MQTIRPWLATLIRLVLGAVFIWTGSIKLAHPRHFVQTVRAFDCTPEWLSKAIGYGLPVLMVVLGLMLVFGVALRLAAAVTTVVYLAFVIGLVEAAARGLHLEWGAFRGGGVTSGSTSYPLEIVVAIVGLALAAFLVRWSDSRISIDEFLARNDHVERPSNKRLRHEQGRRKYETEVATKRKAAFQRGLWLNGSFAAVVVLVTLVGIGVQADRGKIKGTAAGTNATVASGVVWGKKAPATVDIYEDFQCPACGSFARASAAALKSDVAAGKAQVRFHPLSYQSNYSLAAANAALCASDDSVDAFLAYRTTLFGDYKGKRVMPASGGTRTDTDFQDYAAAVKITGTKFSTFVSCQRTNGKHALVAAIEDRASKANIPGTPTVRVNGKTASASSTPALVAKLSKAIAAADVAKPAKPAGSATPSGSPTPAASPSGSASGSKAAG